LYRFPSGTGDRRRGLAGGTVMVAAESDRRGRVVREAAKSRNSRLARAWPDGSASVGLPGATPRKRPAPAAGEVAGATRIGQDGVGLMRNLVTKEWL